MILLAVKLAAMAIGVWPVAGVFGLPRQERAYTTLLMATGLTFGSISALFGYTHHLVNRTQYTELVTVVVLSAFVPTIIAQQFFQPRQTHYRGSPEPGLARAWRDTPGRRARGVRPDSVGRQGGHEARAGG